MTADEMPEPPEHIHVLVKSLLSQGFTEIESRLDTQSFGNVVRVFARAPIRVRIVRDRGDWSAALTADQWPQHDHFGEDWVLLAL